MVILVILNISPISGLLKEPLLILEGIIFFLFLELSAVFWVRIKTQKKVLKSLQEKAYIWLFLGYSIMWFFIILADYHITDPSLSLICLNLGFLIQIICALFFIYIMENYKIFLKKYLFTKIFSIIIPIYLFFFLFAIDYAAYISTSFWIIFFLFFIVYLKEIYLDFHVKRKIGHFKLNFVKIIIGIISVAIGYHLTTRLVVTTLGLGYRLLGDIFQIIGVILLYSCFISIPTFSEYIWQDKIESVIIMHKSGIPIFKKNFREKDVEVDDILISGELALVKLTLEMATRKEAVSVIEKKGKIILIEPSKFIIGVIVCDENLVSFRILLNNFINKIEEIYSKVFEKWDGNLEVFESIKGIAKDIFF